MTKLVKALSEPFNFPYSGKLAFDITMEGTEVPDFVADSMENRFHVSIEDVASTETVPEVPVPGSVNVATLEQMTLPALKGLAEEKGIELGKLSIKKEIIAAIKAGLEAQVESAPEVPVEPEVIPDAPEAPEEVVPPAPVDETKPE